MRTARSDLVRQFMAEDTAPPVACRFLAERDGHVAKLDKLGYNYVIPPEDATPNGAIETLADAKICAELFK